HRFLPRFDAAKRQQILDEPVQAVGVGANVLEKAEIMVRVMECAIQQGFDHRLNGGERSLEFVGNVGNEVLTHLLQFAQMTDVPQDEYRAAHRLTRQARALDCQNFAGGLPLQFAAVRLLSCEGLGNRVAQLAVSQELPELASLAGFQGQAQ